MFFSSTAQWNPFVYNVWISIILTCTFHLLVWRLLETCTRGRADVEVVPPVLQFPHNVRVFLRLAHTSLNIRVYMEHILKLYFPNTSVVNKLAESCYSTHTGRMVWRLHRNLMYSIVQAVLSLRTVCILISFN